MIQVKGLTIKSRLDYARQRGGEPLHQRLRAAPAPLGELARADMLWMRELPLSHDDLLCCFIAQQLGGGENVFREMGAFAAGERRNFQKLIHGLKTDPFELLAGIPRQFHQFLSGDIGAARHDCTGPRGGRIIWEGHARCTLSHCLSSIGYFVKLLELSGVGGTKGENRECIAQGDPRCVWGFQWEQVTGLRMSMKMSAVNL